LQHVSSKPETILTCDLAAHLLLGYVQALKQQESVLTHRKLSIDAATAAAEQQQRELAAKEAAMSAAATKLEQQQATALAASEELERQRKALEAARRGLAGVEAALDAREAQMAESWGQLAANAAALKAGDLDGLSTRPYVSGWALLRLHCEEALQQSQQSVSRQVHMLPACCVWVSQHLSTLSLSPLSLSLPRVDSQDFAPLTGIPGVGAANSNSMVRYSQHNSSSGLLLDPSLPADALAVTLAAKRASLMERESALQVRHGCWASSPHVVFV
jgi:hypothetical protein